MTRLPIFAVILLCLTGCDDDQNRPTAASDAGPRSTDSMAPSEIRDSTPPQAILAVTIGPRALVQGETVAFDEGEQHADAPTVELTVTNLGRAPLSLDAVNVEGEFRASPPPLPVNIAPSMQVTFSISENNIEPGPKRGAIELVTDLAVGGVFRLELSGIIHPFIRDLAVPNEGLESALSTAMEDTQVVGGVLAVVQGREIVFLEGFGHEERRERIGVDPRETRFRWADLSMALTGVLATRAVAAGTIDLDTRIVGANHGYPPPTRYLPDGCRADACAEEIPEDRRNVTFRRLLSHTAGIQNVHNGVADPRPPANANCA